MYICIYTLYYSRWVRILLKKTTRTSRVELRNICRNHFANNDMWSTNPTRDSPSFNRSLPYYVSGGRSQAEIRFLPIFRLFLGGPICSWSNHSPWQVSYTHQLQILNGLSQLEGSKFVAVWNLVYFCSEVIGSGSPWDDTTSRAMVVFFWRGGWRVVEASHPWKVKLSYKFVVSKIKDFTERGICPYHSYMYINICT